MGGRELGLAALDGGQSLAVTTAFADVDTGLQHAEQGIDVRCELLAVARASQEDVATAVNAAADMLERAGGVLPAQPGVLLPGGGDVAKHGVHHGLLIVPYLWGGQTPQVAEEKRLTLVCQLLMLTDSEYAYAVEEGVGAFQEAVAEQGIDLLDWSREG
ncbi:MAG: suppressor of fused domain protein [Corynebacterium flavescens]|nr:suppressor of fused domain protein [Corynebacterium flavescens]